LNAPGFEHAALNAAGIELLNAAGIELFKPETRNQKLFKPETLPSVNNLFSPNDIFLIFLLSKHKNATIHDG
jgi:hypothetical protein